MRRGRSDTTRVDPDAHDPVLLPEVVTAPRLELRQWRVADAAELGRAIGRNLEHLRPWMPWIADEPMSDRARRELITRWEESWRAGGDTVLGVLLGGVIVGGCGLHRRRGPHGLEIGYWIDAGHTRRGFATEVAAALTAAAFDVPQCRFAEIHHDRRNVASAGVPRRLGYRFVGEVPDRVDAPGEEGVDCTWRMDIASWPGPAPA